ncbi:hypothetical protein HHK36_012905 [Tetracentron sinense]|uniref:CAND6/7 N-terminal domain-containing protein n=1 Tax=Tetracentron sinense TaxID=13715 RepID=A0A834Z6N5_TETSI|nr:hypothetical protein HHK36_012905 [Tetracentron sinense]
MSNTDMVAMEISYRASSLISQLIFFTLSFSLSLAEFRSSNIRSDDRRIIHLDEFRFTHTGRLELNVSQISLSNRRVPDLDLDLSQVGFILSSRDSWIHVLEQIQDWEITCPLQSRLVKLVYTLDRLKGAKNFDTLFTETDPNQFMLVFANCLGRLQVSMDVRSAMYNLDGKSGRRDYLSPGKTVLPRVYFIFFWIYFSVGLLLIICLYQPDSTTEDNHFFMLAVVVLKALILLCEAETKSYIMHTDSSAGGWSFLFYIFSFLKVITLIITLSRWFLKLFEEGLIVIVIPLQIVAIVGQVLIDEIAQDWITWKQVLLLVDVVCSCAVFSIVWSWPSSMWSFNRKKEEIFRRYYIFIICNIYSTRLVVYALEIITSYRYLWTSVVAGELAALACYAFTGFMFALLCAARQIY